MGNVKTADELIAGLADTLKQLRLLFEERRKVKALSSTTGPSQERLRAAELESAVEAKELKFQTLPGFVSEISALRVEASWLRGFVKTVGQKKSKW